jgi:glycosyltransferase involved in cell wall biosynthesis
MLRRADAVVGQSKDTLERVRSIYQVDRATELIPLGIERPPPRSQDALQQLNIPESSFVMVAVGRVVARKAAPQLAEVLAGLRPQALLVVGDGPEAALPAGCLRRA